MKTRRNVISFIGFIVIPILLLQFQNCGPSKVGQSTSASDSQARLIEDLNKAQIQFVASEVELKDDVPSASVDGFCNRQHEGAKMNWTVWVGGQNSNHPLLSGVSICHAGNFKVELADLDQVTCGISHLLSIEGDWGSSTFSHFTRRCQALVSQDILPPSGSPAGTLCTMEYSPVVSVEHPCLQICYRDNKVVLSQALEVIQCSSLASSLVTSQ